MNEIFYIVLIAYTEIIACLFICGYSLMIPMEDIPTIFG